MEDISSPIQVLPILNNKGGVGKTTTCVNLAAGLAGIGYRVLLVDLDGQRSASLHLGLVRDFQRPTSADVLFGTHTIDEAICRTFTVGLDLVPGSPALAQADMLLGGSEHPVGALAEALRPARDAYDFILVDCSPSLSLLNVNILVAADALIVPISLSYLVMEGLRTLDAVTRKVWSARKQMVPVLGILRTIYDASSPSQRKMAALVDRRYGGKVFKTVIRECDEIPAASRAHRTLLDHAPASQSAAAYTALACEVADRATRYAQVFPTATRLNAEREMAIAEATLGA